jgi:dihydroorotate dehydrogenase (fumarate)
VYDWEDAIKMLLSGADVVNLTSALLKHGPERIGEILAGMSAWMEARGYRSLADFQGLLSQQGWADVSAVTREGYVMMLDNFTAQAGGA